MNFISHIKEKNQFPILFIGSGIIQRYFKNAPTWEDLLINLWSHVDERIKKPSEGLPPTKDNL